MKIPCQSCGNLAVEITRFGLKPRCRKNVYKFKERERIDWLNDKDLQRTCKNAGEMAR